MNSCPDETVKLNDTRSVVSTENSPKKLIVVSEPTDSKKKNDRLTCRFCTLFFRVKINI